MEFHPEKCQVLRITNKLKPIKADYFVHSRKLIETDHAKYLGVIIDSKLQWKHQIRAVRKKANYTLAFLKRNLYSCTQPIKEKCYKTLVKPILEYGSCVWDPHLKNQINDLEKVQKNAARFVTGDYTFIKGRTDVNMKQLGWIPLREQRARNKTTTFFKGVNKSIDIPISQYQLNTNTRITRQSGNLKFKIPSSNLDSHLYSFFPSTIRLWNSVPNSTKGTNTPEAFKSALKQVTLHKLSK